MIPQLPDAAIAAIEANRHVEAIKILREHTGIGLKEAKEAVDAYLKGKPPAGDDLTAASVPLEATTLLNSGDLIAAIRATREHTGLGLKDSKQLVEHHLATHPATRERFHAITTRKRRRVFFALIMILGLTAIVYSVLTQHI